MVGRATQSKANRHFGFCVASLGSFLVTVPKGWPRIPRSCRHVRKRTSQQHREFPFRPSPFKWGSSEAHLFRQIKPRSGRATSPIPVTGLSRLLAC